MLNGVGSEKGKTKKIKSYFFIFSVIFFFYFPKLWKYMIANLGLIL